jgi:flagellar basal body-associated protein FliL
MADTDEKKEQKGPETKQTHKFFVSQLLPWILLSVVILFCAMVGLELGRLFAGSRTLELPQIDSRSDQTILLKADDRSAKDAGKVWYYDLDPVVANLNEPGVTRYVRATFILEISSEIDEKKGTDFLNEKKPVLINWLTVYLSSLSLDDIRGDKNLRSIQSRVCEAFNEILFPDSRPQIEHVLIKEFPVQ